MIEIFPEPEYRLRPLGEDHPVWRAKHLLNPSIHPLWGIEHGCRTVVIYSDTDLSCFWNQAETSADNPGVVKAIRVGQNVIDYATGREMPADKTGGSRHPANFKETLQPRVNALQIAKLRHAGDWNVAPQAIPNLMDALSKPPYKFDVVITQKELFPRDPNLKYHPLIYIHGRASLSFDKEDLDALRQHLEPGGEHRSSPTAACGRPWRLMPHFFAWFVAEHCSLGNSPMQILIPHDDPIYTVKVGADPERFPSTLLKPAAAADFPPRRREDQRDHWPVKIIGSQVRHRAAPSSRHTGIECKGYTYESAIKIAGNIVIYSTLP